MAPDAQSSIDQLVTSLAQALISRHWTVATAESCTGGLIAAALTELAGSSAWFERGLVTYSNQAKMTLLGVSQALLERDGAVSEACAQAMAEGCVRNTGVDAALSVTGIAGPGGGSADKPVGTVCFGWSLKDHATRVTTRHFAGDRRQVRVQSVRFALEGLLAMVSSSGPATSGTR